MTQAAAGSELDERVPGRRWTVRLDPVGRGSAEVRVSCGRPACAEQRLPSAAAGRAAAVAHLKAHLRATPAPRADTYCACRADGCRAHVPDTGRDARTAPWRCGGPVVLAVVADRAGRWWQALECCSRCAAVIPGAQTAGPSRPSAPPAPGRPAPAAPRTGTTAPQFSDRQQVTAGAGVPGPRPEPTRRRRPEARISQRVIPRDLRPLSLRDELVELGGLFRAYQRRAEPDLSMLADLQERKARAFLAWSDASCDVTLRLEAQRAEQAAAVIRRQHRHRTGEVAEGEEPGVARLLNVPQWEYARSVLTHVAGHTPLPGAEARLLVLMLTLRTAHTGTGNLVGQDVTGLGLTDPEDLIGKLTGCGWLDIPGTVGDLLASRPENPTPVTVPSLVPGTDGSGPFTFGRKTRPKLSGWAQRVVSDKKLRKAKAPAGIRLLALTLATSTDDTGRLGPGGQGIPLNTLATRVPADAGELRYLMDRLTAADWLAEAALTDTHLTGQLTERVLPLTCPYNEWL